MNIKCRKVMSEAVESREVVLHSLPAPAKQQWVNGAMGTDALEIFFWLNVLLLAATQCS